jgi:hypothetical protein
MDRGHQAVSEVASTIAYDRQDFMQADADFKQWNPANLLLDF